MQPMQLIVHHEIREDAVVLHVKGDIDMAVADELKSHLRTGLTLADAGRPLIIDLQAVDFMGSVGLTALLTCHYEGLKKQIAVGVVSTNPATVRMVNMTRLDDILELFPSIDSALHLVDRVRPRQHRWAVGKEHQVAPDLAEHDDAQ